MGCKDTVFFDTNKIMKIFFCTALNPHLILVNKKQSIVNKNINVSFAISKNSYNFAMSLIINEFFRW